MKKSILIIAASLVLAMLTSCELPQKQTVNTDYKYYAYYLDSEKNKLLREGIETSEIETMKLNDSVEKIIERLKNPNGKNYVSVLSDEIKIINFEIENQQLILNFSSSYLELPPDLEVLIRATLIKSFGQLENIQKISFTVDSQPLTDSNGKIIGPMDKNSFVENMGSDINNYQEDIIQLYFSDKKYKKLVKTGIKVMRRTNIPREKTILDYLFKGPLKEFEGEVFPTIPPELKINSIITKNGVCYIDLSEKNVTSETGVPSELVIYSIVNSLTEDSSIIKVKFSIDSNEAAVYRGIKLDEAFERKETIIK